MLKHSDTIRKLVVEKYVTPAKRTGAVRFSVPVRQVLLDMVPGEGLVAP